MNTDLHTWMLTSIVAALVCVQMTSTFASDSTPICIGSVGRTPMAQALRPCCTTQSCRRSHSSPSPSNLVLSESVFLSSSDGSLNLWYILPDPRTLYYRIPGVTIPPSCQVSWPKNHEDHQALGCVHRLQRPVARLPESNA